MTDVPSLSGQAGPLLALEGNAILRPLLPPDVSEDYVDGLNDPRVNAFLVGPRSRLQTRSMVCRFVQDNLDAPDAVLFGLFIDKRLCGTTRLHDVTADNAFVGVAIFRISEWGKGWGSRVVRAVSDHALSDLCIARVRAGIEPGNVASQRVFSKAGFTLLRPPIAGPLPDAEQVWERVQTVA